MMAIQPLLVSKQNTKFPAWRYFGFEQAQDGKLKDLDKPKCKLCHEEVTTRFGNTSNLFAHPRNKHPSVYQELIVEQGGSSGQTWERSEDSEASIPEDVC